MFLQGAAPQERILMLASENWLNMVIGKYQQGRGWIGWTDFYEPPPPDAVFSIFGVTGKLGEITLKIPRKPNPYGVNIDWSEKVERGATASQPYALAVEGSWPDQGLQVEKLALDDPTVLKIARDYLKFRGLDVDQPFITEAYRADLNGDGIPEILLCAHSDRTKVRDDEPASIYAVALLQTGAPGKERTLEIAGQTSYKPKYQSIEEHLRYHGRRDFFRFLAFYDARGKGRKQIFLYRAKDGATEVDAFAFNGRHLKQVLTAYKPHYN